MGKIQDIIGKFNSKSDNRSVKWRRGLVASTISAFILVAFLLNLGLTQFTLKSYAIQDSYAVPVDVLADLLNSADYEGQVTLIPIEMGDALYVQSSGGDSLFIGEEKTEISGGNPVLSQQGQVLHFLNDTCNMVTSDWKVLTSYEGLYLSDGMTYNADRSQADMDEIILVQVEGGYQVAQATVLQSGIISREIPMNAICSFTETEVVYYTYQNGILYGDSMTVTSNMTITIGENKYNYFEFLELLGLWAEQVVFEPTVTEPVETEEPEPEEQSSSAKAPSAATTPKPSSNSADEAYFDEPSDVVSEPAPPSENPNSVPSSASAASSNEDTSYTQPSVKLGSLSSWVYTVSTKVSIDDPSGAMTSSVQIYVYKVAEDGTETQVLRQSVSTDKEVDLGQLEPDTTYHIVAYYEYNNASNYPRSETIDKGTITTTSFDSIGTISFSFEGEHDIDNDVEIFPFNLQVRDMLFNNVSNGTTVEIGSVSSHPDTDALMAETYVNSIKMTATEVTAEAVFNEETGEYEIVDEGGGRSTTVTMETEAVRLLREGYNVSFWNTAETMSSGTEYNYTFTLTDKYGNIFTLTDEEVGYGHTSLRPPTVKISVPDIDNVSGSTRITTELTNLDALELLANDYYDDAAMGSEQILGLFIVNYGDEVVPENALDLEAYVTDNSSETYEGKFLPISSILDEDNTSLTDWVVTNLAPLYNFSAGVIVGHYDSGDYELHYDEVLEETVDFFTASLSNLGSISYTASVEDVTHDSGVLKFRMNSADERLIVLLDYISFTVSPTEDTADLQTVMLSIDELSEIEFNPILDEETGLYTATAEIPVFQNDEEEPVLVNISYTGTVLPMVDDEATAETVWEYIIYMSKTTALEDCWLYLELGQALEVAETELPENLMTFTSRTAYMGDFKTEVEQGGVITDVSSPTDKTVYFETLSEEAVVDFTNAFVSNEFIELYGLSITDPDECIMEDDADRGGNNVQIQILTQQGVVVSSIYINSDELDSVVRIDGLNTDTTYIMQFVAVKYRDTSTSVETNRSLEYTYPQDETTPTQYIFTTGESVEGSITLDSISQLYVSDSGSITDSVSLLSSDDFYLGIWQYSSNTYYKSEAEYAQYLADAAVIEDDEFMDAALGNEPYLYTKDIATYSSSSSFDDMWTSKFIPVSSGDMYSIYNTAYNSYQRVSFYYEDANGDLRCYGEYTTYEYYRGDVFQVPTYASSGGNANAEKIVAMRLAGTSSQVISDLMLTKYDSSKTNSNANLIDDTIRIASGMSVSTSNTVSVNSTYAYTADYVPVTSGSVYELKGRDPNSPDEKAYWNSNCSSLSVVFYDDEYTFLGGYTVGAQTALVKAPFNAAYCRFNITLDQSGDTMTLNTDALSMKLYSAAVTDQYLVTLDVDLADNSDEEEQMMIDGSYIVTMYTTTSAVTDADDLSSMPMVQLGDAQEIDIVNADFVDGKLDISRIIEFDNLSPNMGYCATLEIVPVSWEGQSILIDTAYFTTTRVTQTISNLAELKAIYYDPAGSYIVTADIDNVSAQITGSDRPFSGTIDFQGHTITMTTVNELFYRVNDTGVIKNGIINYAPVNTISESAASYVGSITEYNYGTIQNMIVNLAADYTEAPAEFNYAGGITRYNYGTIENFIVNFTKDIRVGYYFGGVASHNYGIIRNGYVNTEEINDGATTRNARLVHTYLNHESYDVAYTNTTSIGYIAGQNLERGSIDNVFVIGDLLIESASATSTRNNADYSTDNSDYETSTSNTAYAAIGVGLNYGVASNIFTVGDRIDYDFAKNNYQYMLDRGPTIGHVTGLYTAENITYFSNSSTPYSQYSSGNVNIGTYNIPGDTDSLYDFMWYESTMGTDGSVFDIRDNVDEGYYPQLILSSYFSYDDQPKIELPDFNNTGVEVLSNEVRLEGTEEILTTVTLTFPYSENSLVTKMTVVDSNNVAIDCEVLAQRVVEDEYRVDILLSMPEESDAIATDEYTITAIYWTGGYQSYTGTSGERIIKADFWDEISSIDEWKTELINVTSYIYGNYRLTADLDFSLCTTSSDWYVSQRFYGKLDGGIYSTKSETLTDSAGETIFDAEGDPRTIIVNDELTDMYTISGVGNVDSNGDWSDARDATYSSAIMCYLYGEMSNLVFSNFINTNDLDVVGNATLLTSGYNGVIIRAEAGSRIDNCHVRDSQFYSDTFLGGLVAYGTGTSITNSSVRGVTLENYRASINNTETVYEGGLVGYLTGSFVENCFAADLDITAPDVYYGGGFGGVIGYTNSSVVSNCYSTGLINVGSSRVGGITGVLTGTSELYGCWSSATVMTISDYAGGIVGYHAGGVLINNYTSSTIITRSLASNFVHRICSNTAFNQDSRHDNYAFSGQYLTYEDVDASDIGESFYQFGIWEDTDGATALFDIDDLMQTGIWTGVMGFSDSFDVEGSARTTTASGSTTVSSVTDAVMPKLVNDENVLLYDQPDVEIGYVTTSSVGRVSVIQDITNEALTVSLALFSDRDGINSMAFSEVADWSNMVVTGATVKSSSTSGSIGGINDLGGYTNTSLDSRAGRAFGFTLEYGAAADSDGHYLDSYMMLLPVYDDEGNLEILQARISLSEPVYKYIYSIDEWNTFFANSNFANSYENVMIGWANNVSDPGVIDFSNYSTTQHLTSVKVNRLVGEYNESEDAYPTISGLEGTFTTAAMQLVSQAVTKVENLHFEDISMIGTTSGNNKGVIGQLEGDIENVTFDNITIDGGSGSYVGVIGTLSGEASDITLTDITVTTTGSYVGGLAGQTATYSTLDGVTLDASEGNRNTVTSVGNSYSGGLVGMSYGIVRNSTVDNTDVIGRYMVGGAVGYANGDAGREEEYKMENVIVGSLSDTNAGVIGVNGDASVTVTLEDYTSSSSLQYAGGVVGYAGGRSMSGLYAYNVEVSVPERGNADINAYPDTEGSYGYYVGGVVGGYGSGLINSLAQNCDVISYGGYVGGIGGNGAGWYNTAKNCVIYSISEDSNYTGGIVGVASVSRSLAQNCVISGGNNVGGTAGKMTSNNYENAVLDCTIIGEDNVGGIAGWMYAYYDYKNVVSGTNGTYDTVVTTLTEDIVSPSLKSMFSDDGVVRYSATTIIGETNVGGHAGLSDGIITYYNSVDDGVSVIGDTNVGGFAGQYKGSNLSYYATTTRQFAVAQVGANVTGDTNVGGLFGEFTSDDYSEQTVYTEPVTGYGPYYSYYRGLLVTADVTGKTNVDILMPTPVDDADYANYGAGSNYYFYYTRVAENSTVNGKTVSELYDFKTYDDVRAGITANGKNDYAGTITLSDDNLNLEEVYSGDRSTTTGGLGWSREYMTAEPMQSMYTQVDTPATFSSYETGIESGGLEVWLDARNNTGKGYTDETAVVWKNLTSGDYDATLYWNGNTSEDAVTFAEMRSYTTWDEGAFEMNAASSEYYAQFETSLSPILTGEYTIEIVYSYTNQTASGGKGFLSWADGTTRGGVGKYYNTTSTTNYAYVRFDTSNYGNMGSIASDYINDYLCTSTYVSDGSKISYYQDGTLLASTTPTTTSFTDSETATWRVGYGLYSNEDVRIYAIRVYSDVLTADEIASNAAYDAWYYFGEDMPDGATTVTPTLSLSETDGGTTGTMLLRSEDGSYNGTLVNSNYQGEPLYSRGYYYLMDSSGNYSNIVAVNAPNYGPQVLTTSLTNEYYGSPTYDAVNGQSGQNSLTGNVYDVDDLVFENGYDLPTVGIYDRGVLGASASTASAMNTMLLSEVEAPPSVTAYASGIDTVNLEIMDDAPTGLSYELYLGDEVIQSGEWPSESRTITMTWDYSAKITLKLGLNGLISSDSWSYSDLASSVMVDGSEYWYLFGSECYDSETESLDPTITFIHMYDGEILDDDGNIWDIRTMKMQGSVSAGEITETVPLYYGNFDGSEVMSFGTYMISEGGLKETQFVVKDSVAYTMPSSNVTIGSFIIDSYGTNYYNTVLKQDGELSNMGNMPNYPEGMLSVGIREISNNLNSDSKIVLIRYNTGTLIAFNYLTGESIEVLSQDESDISLLEFASDSFEDLFNTTSLLSGGAGQSLYAVEYEAEVEADPSLSTALTNLQNNDTIILTDGEGEGVLSENSDGGTDEETDGGTDEDNGEEPSAELNDIEEETAEAEESESSDDDDDDEIVLPTIVDSGEVTGEGTVLTDASFAEFSSSASASYSGISTRYVTVYDTESEEIVVYDVQELLTTPTEELVTQEERATQLEEIGFKTSLLQQKQPTETEANGIMLIILTSCGIMVMLAGMMLIRRTKVDNRNAKH